MHMDTYQYGTSQTAAYPNETQYEALCYVGLGLASEAGEVAGKLKKMLRDDGGELTGDRRAQVISELGDVLWYCSQLATEIGISLSVVAQGNLDKLASRAKRDAIRGSGDRR